MKRILLTGIMLAGLAAHDVSAAQIWFAAVDPVSQPNNPATVHFMDLFRPNARWNNAAKKIQVLKISTQFLHTAPEESLAAVIDDAKRRNLSIAMEGFLLTASLRCGNGGVESYSSPGTIHAIIERLTRLGGTLSYVAMDEPVHFGHYAEGGPFCHDTIEALAAQMVPNVKALKAAFPSIKFGDIEPLNQYTMGRIDTMLTFAKSFYLATGEPISFFQADIGWRGNEWHPQLMEWQKKADAAGISLGVIINGDNHDNDDLAWAKKAVQRYGIVMRSLPRPPDQIVFQSWMKHPSTTVPDDQPGTLSSIVVDALGR